MNSLEMTDVKHHDDAPSRHGSFDKTVPTPEAGVDELNHMDEASLAAMERKLVRRIDIRMMPALILVYIMSVLRRLAASTDPEGTTWVGEGSAEADVDRVRSQQRRSRSSTRLPV